MWPIKTKEEIREAYLAEIRSLQANIDDLKFEIEKQERKIGRTEGRIKQLEETAKIFE